MHLIPNWFRSSCSQIVVFQNFAKFTWKNLCWSHFLTTLQISRSETLLKRDSGTGIFLWIFCNFSKNLFTEHLWMTAPADSSVLTKPLFIDDTLFFFPSFFLLLLIIAWEFTEKVSRNLEKYLEMKIFFAFYNSFLLFT